ncbi:MAG: nucleoside triphosphate pyrophosphohydrolase [Spirochaetales bacterium]
MDSTFPNRSELAGQNADSIVSASRKAADSFATLYTIIARLRAPDGCPWDREQSPASIRNNIVEEAYELVEAITEKESGHIREEAGDLYMLATMVAYMFEEEKSFSVAQALDAVSEKLVRRHPHVFGDSKVDTPDAVVEQWNTIKEQKEGRRKKDSLLDEVPRHLPPLERAYKIQKKAAKVGFDWTHIDSVWDKIEEELKESRDAFDAKDGDELESEIGDLLYSVINLARFSGIDPAIALQRTNEKFSHRFRHVEKRMKEEGLPLAHEHMAAMDRFWEEAKEGR